MALLTASYTNAILEIGYASEEMKTYRHGNPVGLTVNDKLAWFWDVLQWKRSAEMLSPFQVVDFPLLGVLSPRFSQSLHRVPIPTFIIY